MSTEQQVIEILQRVLSLGARARDWTGDTRLLGSLPELDSMAVVSVLTAFEDELGIAVDDNDVGSETFETVGTLTSFVDAKRGG